MAGGWGDFALTSPVTDLGLRRELKRAAAEQAEEALLQEAKDLAEVTNCSGQGVGLQALGGHMGHGSHSPLPDPPPLPGATLQTPMLHCHPTCMGQVRSLDLPSEAHALASLQALDPEEREPRSPRRCVRLHESCLGHQVPCCDPCATCYCRFFNAFCYCRKLGTAMNPCSRT